MAHHRDFKVTKWRIMVIRFSRNWTVCVEEQGKVLIGVTAFFLCTKALPWKSSWEEISLSFLGAVHEIPEAKNLTLPSPKINAILYPFLAHKWTIKLAIHFHLQNIFWEILFLLWNYKKSQTDPSPDRKRKSATFSQDFQSRILVKKLNYLSRFCDLAVELRSFV